MDIKHTLSQWAYDPSFIHGRMSFVSGPRQIGKTTLARTFLKQRKQAHNYYNWDSLTLKQNFAVNPLFFIENLTIPLRSDISIPPENKSWVVFDEIHKYPKWKNLLKGYYDEWRSNINFIITGSARLDYFRTSGDSLVGRYFLFHMNPLHPHDLTGHIVNRETTWSPLTANINFDPPTKSFQEAAEILLNISGFPEPVSVGTEEFYRRWKNDHISLITSEDVRDLTNISNIQKLQTLVFLLPERIGSPLSLNSLKNILDCAHASVQNWLEALKKVYLIFDISPFAGRLKRSVIKEKKYYFWDWGILSETGKRFENFIAVQLQRAVSIWNEWGKGDFRLYYVRTKDGREVDFVITESNNPLVLIECKKEGKSLSSSLAYFLDRIPAPLAFQVLNTPGNLKQTGKGLFLIGMDRFLRLLP